MMSPPGPPVTLLRFSSYSCTPFITPSRLICGGNVYCKCNAILLDYGYLHADVVSQLGRHSRIVDEDIHLAVQEGFRLVPHLPPAFPLDHSLYYHTTWYEFNSILSIKPLDFKINI